MNLSQNVTVLIVDDEPDVSNFIKIKLGLDAPHFSLDTVVSGSECLEYLREKPVDCILSDYQMPGMNGMELLLAMRDSGDVTPFIFITGQGNEEVAREAFLNGADDYFTKEIGFAHFTRIINSIEKAIKHRDSNADKLRAERELEEEKNKLEAMFASMPDGLSIIGPDFTILRQNRVQIERVGDRVGEKCYEAYHGKSQVCDGCMVEMAFEDGETHSAERAREVDGYVRYYDITAAPVRDISGSVIACLEITVDITDRRRAEEALMKEKLFTDTSVNSMPGIFYIFDENLHIVRWNEKLLECTGFTASEITKVSVMDIVAPESREAAAAEIRAVMEKSESRSAELLLLDHEGNKVPHYCTGTPMVMEGRMYLVGVGIDITARKKAEEELRASQQFLETIIETEPECVKILNPDGTLELMNRAGLDMIEAKSLEQVKGKKVTGLIAPEDREAFMEVGKRVFSGEPAELEFDMIGLGGRRLTLETRAVPLHDNDGRITALLGVTRDVTERKRIEERLEQEHAQFLAILDSISEIVYVSDPDTYEVLYANRALKERFGKNPVGGLCYREFQGISVPCDFCTNDIIRKQKGEVYKWEYHNPVLGIDLLVADSIIKWPDGRDVRFELAVDITEQKNKKRKVG